MPWRVQSVSEGPLVLSDIGLTFRKGDIRDLDLIGRENAERSNDIKYALIKGWLVELEKGPGPDKPAATGVDPAVVAQLSAAAQKADQTVTKLEQSNQKLQEQLKIQSEKLDQQEKHNAEVMAKADMVLEEVKTFFHNNPLDIRVFKEALENIKVERSEIKDAREVLKDSGDSEAEIAARDRILKLKDEKLEKNAGDIGKSISKSADDIDQALDAMDELGI